MLTKCVIGKEFKWDWPSPQVKPLSEILQISPKNSKLIRISEKKLLMGHKMATAMKGNIFFNQKLLLQFLFNEFPSKSNWTIRAYWRLDVYNAADSGDVWYVFLRVCVKQRIYMSLVRHIVKKRHTKHCRACTHIYAERNTYADEWNERFVRMRGSEISFCQLYRKQ